MYNQTRQGLSHFRHNQLTMSNYHRNSHSNRQGRRNRRKPHIYSEDNQEYNRNEGSNIARKALELLTDYNCFVLSKKRRNAVKALLELCSPNEPVANVIHTNGYDLFQYLTSKKDLTLLQYCYNKGFNLKVNHRVCSSLLNIACNNDASLDIVVFLLGIGADVHFRSSLCFPRSVHNNVRSHGYCAFERFHHEVFHEECFTPVDVAILNDNLQLLKLLLNDEKTNKKYFADNALLIACKKGALNCLSYLIDLYPAEVNYHRNHVTLGHYAFKHSEALGLLFLTEAIKVGIKPSVINAMGDGINTAEGTLLHDIYKHDHITKLYEITSKTIEAGFTESSIIQTGDRQGYTLIQSLIENHVNTKISPWFVAKQFNPNNIDKSISFEGMTEKLETERAHQVFATLKLLVDKGCPLNTKCNFGETAMHKLLKAFQNANSNNLHNLSKLLPQIIQLSEYLLRNGLDINAGDSEYRSSPLNCLVYCLCDLSPSNLETHWPSLHYLLTLFLQYGADPNVPSEVGAWNVSLLLTTLHRWINNCISDAAMLELDKDLPLRLLIRVQNILTLFLQHGLNLDYKILELYCKQVAILSNMVYDDCNYMKQVQTLLKILFLYGIDPNKLSVITEGTENYMIPCQLHAQFYFSRSFIIHNQSDNMFSFINIFSNTLDEKSHHTLLTGLCNILRDNFQSSDSSECLDCIEKIARLKKQVRPLKTLTRISVIKCLSWKVEEKKRFLPLPKLLQDYITHIDR